MGELCIYSQRPGEMLIRKASLNTSKHLIKPISKAALSSEVLRKGDLTNNTLTIFL